MKNYRHIIWFPIWFAIIFILFNYFFVGAFQSALTSQAADVFSQRKGALIFASSLFLLPNFFLSFLLWSYSRTEEESFKELYLLCFLSIGCGLLPQIFIYTAYYLLWYQSGTSLPLVMFGFPFVYLLGMLIGWVIGLFILSYYKAR